MEQTIQAREITYGEWYQDRLATVTLPALSVIIPALLTSFGLGWNLDVVTDEFNLSRTQVKKLTDTLELMTANEVIAYGANGKSAKLYLILIRTERLQSNYTIVVTKLGN